MAETTVRKSAPDGGYGWFICAAACTVHFVIAGIQNNIGILYIYILEEFGGGRARSAWVGSVHHCALFFTAPLVTMGCDRWGCRVTGFVGGVLTIVGIGVSSVVTELYVLCVTYGALFGIGASLCYITTFRVISQWFDRHLALAIGICTAAQYAGTVALSCYLSSLGKNKGLASILVILTGISSVTAVAALVYQQPPDVRGEAGPEKKSFKQLFDLSVFKIKPFLILVVGVSVYAVGAFIAAAHGPSFATETGVSASKVAYLPMAWSISSVVFSFCFGKIADKLRTHRLWIFQVAMFGVATSTALLSAASSFESFVPLMVMYGAFDCGFVLLTPVMAEDMVGSDQASRGVGLIYPALGIAYLSGPPLIGWIFDVSKSYPLGFLVASAFSAAGGCILFLIPVFQAKKRSVDTRRSKTNKDLELTEPRRNSLAIHQQLDSSKLPLPWVPEVLSRHAFVKVGQRPTDRPRAGNERRSRERTSGKERLDLPCWVNFDLSDSSHA